MTASGTMLGVSPSFQTPLPTLITRKILSENEKNLDYTTCILGCKPIGGILSCPYTPSDKEVEGDNP